MQKKDSTMENQNDEFTNKSYYVPDYYNMYDIISSNMIQSILHCCYDCQRI